MTLLNVHKIVKPDYLMLLFIMALAFYLAFIPHHNYPYPVHVDEWMHLTYSKAILQAGNTTFVDPFYGEKTIGLTEPYLGISPRLEFGFHLFWGVFHQISGIPWLTIFKYFPGIIYIITILSVYILARRQGFGWEASFFTCLIPTTVGILGPAFLVPVAMGLLFISLSLFVAFNFRTVWSYLVLFIFICFLLSVHAATAVGLVIILVPYILLNVKGKFTHSLGITLALGIPFLVFPWIFQMLLPTVKELLTPQPLLAHVDLPRIINTYGYLPVLFCLLGTFLLVIRGGKKNYGLVLGLLALAVMLATFFTFHYGVTIMYYRGLMYAMLMMSVVAGAGLMGVKELRLPVKLTAWLKAPLITKNAGNILCLVFIGLTLAMCIPSHLNEPYYHMIDEQDYEAFVWIRENVDNEYEKAILDPWKGTAFAAIAERYVYTKILAYDQPRDREAYEFLRGGSSDTDYLKGKGISIIYTRVYDWRQHRNIEYSANNPDLVEVRKNIYLLKETRESK